MLRIKGCWTHGWLLRRSAATALLVLVAAAVAGPAAAFPALPYLPLTPGTTYTMLRNNSVSFVRTIGSPTTINGLSATPITAPSGDAQYFSNDAGNGIRVHRVFATGVSLQCGITTETDTYSPPLVVATPDISFGQQVNSSGTVNAVACSGGFNSNLGYNSTVTVSGPQLISVPAGQFQAAQISVSVFISGVGTRNSTYWVAAGIGSVRDIDTNNNNFEMVSTSIVRTSPDPFSFTAQTGLAPGATATSDTITVTGTTANSAISITGGLYSINGGPYTSGAGTVSNGQTVTLRQTASAFGLTTTNAVLTIGGVGATFAVTTAAIPTYALTVNVTGSGTVTGNPAGINCGVTCAANYVQGTGVTLTPTPAANYQFTGWSGACTGSGSCTVTMNAPATVTATFTLVPDTQAPTVPTGLTATAVSGAQINLSWTASTDNRAVASYQIYRNNALVVTVSGLATKYNDTNLAALSVYLYKVAACDAATNCSAQSGQAAAQTLAAGQFSFSAPLESGFNLGSNSLNATLDVIATFGNQGAPVAGVTANIVSVWKWNAAQQRWAFFSPQLTGAANASYAASHNFEVLSSVNPGEGYWVNAINPMTLPAQNGTGFAWNGFNFVALSSGFNLIAQANAVTPSQFNSLVSQTPPAPGVVPTDNFVSLWAWDAVAAKWYFYSPLLEASGGLAAVKSYADSHNYLHFQDYAKEIGIGTGFWVNRP